MRLLARSFSHGSRPSPYQNGEPARRLRECRPDRSKVKTLLLQRCALCNFHLVEGQNARDQVTTDKRFKRSSSEFILCISLTLS